MSTLLHLRISLAWVLICSLFVTGLLTITIHQSHASNNSLMRSSTSSGNESSEETGPPEETGPQAETVDEATRSRVSEALGKLPLSFEENRGQVDKEAKFISRGRGYTLFLTPTEAVLALSRGEGKKTTPKADARRPHIPAQPRHTRTSVVRMKLKGANQTPAMTGESKMGVRTNYFKGNDPAKWHTDVARYERVRYAQVYPGIDIIYYGQQQQLEYDFEVAPGAETRRIAVEYRGVKRVRIERGTGELVLKTAGGEVRQQKPVAYQEVGGTRREVESRYVMKGKRKVGIQVGEYDRTQRLVIDPILSYSTYLGGSGSDYGEGIAIDSSGNAYVTGKTSSSDFPTYNQYQTYQGGGNYGTDAFVMKLNPNMSGVASLLYSTYLGGSDDDYGYGIAVDASGYAYVTGYTDSYDFPTLNQYQTDQDYGDAFVTKLDTNASGAASLLYSTYLGGDSSDYGYGIAVDAAGHAYVVGTTNSSDFPTFHQYQTDQAFNDAFVTKLTDTYSISGRVTSDGTTGISGVTVTLSGSKTRTITTNSTGNYSFTNLPLGGGYTVTLAKGNLTFIPLEQSFNDLHTTQTNVNFTTRPAAISGKITKGTDEGAALAGVTVTLTGGAGFTPRTVTTANNGTYSFTAVPTPGNYKIKPTRTNYSFSPAQLLFYNVSNDLRYANFVATLKTYTISGVVRLGAVGLSGVTVRLTSPTPAGFATRKATTDSTGAYSFPNVPAGRNYTVTPQKTDYQFTPTNKALLNLSANQTAVNFAVKVYSISGRVTRTGTTTGIGAVTVGLTSPTPAGYPARTAQTYASGNYYFYNLPAGRDYTITPSKSGYTFSPATRSITNLNNNIPEGASTNFTGTGP